MKKNKGNRMWKSGKVWLLLGFEQARTRGMDDKKRDKFKSSK